MSELCSKATETKVNTIYVDEAKILSDKMQGSIKARDTFQMLHDYP